MLFKKILLFWVLISLITLTNGQPSKKVYPDADAVYLSLAKTFVLNKDGSIITTVEKRQKLLTHRAFQKSLRRDKNHLQSPISKNNHPESIYGERQARKN